MHALLPRLAIALALVGICACAGAADLTITVKGLTSDKGKILVALYTNAGDWLKTPARAGPRPPRSSRVPR